MLFTLTLKRMRGALDYKAQKKRQQLIVRHKHIDYYNYRTNNRQIMNKKLIVINANSYINAYARYSISL